MLFLFLSTSSACFQLLQSLLKYTPITFSLTSLKVKVTCAPHTTDVAVMDVLGCVACGLLVQLPQRCRISALPEKFTHLHIGIGENLTDGFQVRSPGSENGSDLPLVTYPVGSRTRVTVLVYLLFLPSLENYRSGNQVKGETRVCTDSRARQDLSWMAGGGTHESHFPSSFHCLMKKMGIWLMLPVCWRQGSVYMASVFLSEKTVVAAAMLSLQRRAKSMEQGQKEDSEEQSSKASCPPSSKHGFRSMCYSPTLKPKLIACEWRLRRVSPRPLCRQESCSENNHTNHRGLWTCPRALSLITWFQARV